MTARERLAYMARKLRFSAVLYREDSHDAATRAIGQERAACVIEMYAALDEDSAKAQLDVLIRDYPNVASFDPERPPPTPAGPLS